MRGSWGHVLIAAYAIGCSTNYHVNIPAPPPDLDEDERAQFFETYRQGGRGVEWTTTCTNHGCTTVATDLLLLRNGAEIRHGEDLLPVLAPNSVAERAAQDIVAAKHRKSRWKKIGWLGFGGGIVVAIAGAKLGSSPVADTGLISMVGVPFVAIIAVIVNNMNIHDATKTEFAAYDQSLAERLALCVNGLDMVPCESNTPGTPPSEPAPDPALRSLRQK